MPVSTSVTDTAEVMDDTIHPGRQRVDEQPAEQNNQNDRTAGQPINRAQRQTLVSIAN